MAEMKISDWMRVATKVLLCGAILGGAIGWIVSKAFLSGYRASISFPLLSEVSTYRRIEDLLHSADWFREFARAYNADPVLSAAIANQLLHGRSKVIKFDHAFRIQRSDLRDLPEPAMKEMAPAIIKDGRSDLVVSAKENDPAHAIALADLGIRFARHVLLRVTLTDWIPPWKAAVEREFVDIQAAILTHRASVEALARRIADLEALRLRYRDVNGTSPAISGVQVQVAGPRYLAISQQLVGLESELIDLRENLRQTEASMAKIETLRKVTARFDEVFRTEPNSEKAVLLMEKDVLDFLKLAENPGTPLASRLALTTIWKSISGHRDRYIDGLFSPPNPVVRPDGFPRSLIVLLGALFGLLLAAVGLTLRNILAREVRSQGV